MSDELQKIREEGYQARVAQIKEQYAQALTLDAARKEIFGVNMLFSCAFAQPDNPNELLFELGMNLIALAAKEGRKYAYSEAAGMFSDENRYGSGDDHKVLQIYCAGAENGDPYSFFRLGEIYRCGEYKVECNFKKALEYYRQGVVQNSPECQYVMAKIIWLWYDEFGLEKDVEYARDLLERSHANGRKSAKALLAILHYQELQDAQTAEKLLRESVAEGCTDAYIAMGEWYEQGVIFEKDAEKAVQYYKLAAKLDNALAKKICKQKKIDYRVKFTAQPRQITYEEPLQTEDDEETYIPKNGITYDCFLRYGSEAALRGCYFRILDVLEEKYGTNYDQKILEFTTLENIFYSVDWFLCELEEGGLKQYFANSSTITVNGLLQALNDIGAEASFKVISACLKYSDSADDVYYERKEKKLKENLRHYAMDYLLENYPKDLKI